MNETNPYAILGLSADAPFEDIQAARAQLLLDLDENDRQRQVVEAAYDAILMQRLQLRKEGKVKVPDRIRFPEAQAQVQPTPMKTKPPVWWQSWTEPPTPRQLGLSAGVFGGLWALSLVPKLEPSYILSLAVLASAYLLFQKNGKLLRSFALSLGILTLGGTIAYLLASGFNFPQLVVALVLLAYGAATAYLK